MSSVVVADSSCLIGLSKIGKLHVLQDLFGQILIPTAVHYETVTRGKGRLGALEIAQAEWILPVAITDHLTLRTLKLTLGAGESEAIVLASEKAADIIVLDDWQARRVALGLGLPVVGTVAILDRAVEKGFLADLTASLEELRRAGFRF
ncbi:MAG: DUF3368 domain-containing protein [Candidatus Methylumidiphilus sp.]